MRKFLIAAIVVLLVVPALLRIHYTSQNKPVEHRHGWSNWQEPVDLAEEKLEKNFIQFRSCTNCGLSEYRPVLKVKE